MNWTLIVLLLSLVLAILLIVKEIRRPNPARLTWRLVASLLAAAALACIALPVSYAVNGTATAANEAVLLTPGFARDSLKVYKGERLFTLDQAIHKAYPQASLISNVNDLKATKPAVAHLHIFGNGLIDNELSQLNGLPVTFHAAQTAAAFNAISWNETLKAGEPLRIQGRFSNTGNSAARIVLKSLSTAVDSVSIPAGASQSFELKTVPKLSGLATFNILVIAAGDTLEKGTVPVQIASAKPLKLLLLAASPDFENKFLKNWLAQNGYALAYRAVISKDKVSSEFVNLPEMPLASLSAATLSKFDVVIGDLSALKSLKPAEGVALKNEVTANGLGLIVKADSAGKGSEWLQANFPLDRLSSKGQIATALTLAGNSGKTAKLNIDPVYISLRGNTQPLATDDNGHIIASSTLAGSGKLAWSVLNNTYNWMLAGNHTDYTALWSLLISKVARRLPPSSSLQVLSTVPAINNEVNLAVSGIATTGKIMINNSIIALAQQPDMPFIYSTAFWPEKPGWQQLSIAGNTQQHWYGYSTAEWNGLTIQKTMAHTRNYASVHPFLSSVTKQIHQKEQIEVPKIYFYVLLLAMMTFLWAEAKFLQ